MSNKTTVGSKKQTLKQQLLGAISMLCIAAVALTGATYAWFTFVANPEITDIDMYVRAAEELYLSPYHLYKMDPADPAYGTGTNPDPYYDPTLWFATITRDMIQLGTGPNGALPDVNPQANSFPIAPNNMKDLSSIFSTINRNFFGRTLDALGHPLNYVQCTTNPNVDGYIQFDLWAKASSSGVVYLDNTQLKSFVQAIDAVGGNQMTGGTNKKQFIENTVRVGFYTASEGSASEASPVPRSIIWEPNSTGHLPSVYSGLIGITGKRDTYAITQPDVIDDTATGGTKSYLDEKSDQAGGVGAKLKQTTYDFGASNFVNTIPDYQDKIALFALKAGSAVKFTVAIWVEGADVDTLNAVSDSYFRTLLTFGHQSGATDQDFTHD